MAYALNAQEQDEENKPFTTPSSGEIVPEGSSGAMPTGQPQKQEKGGAPFADISRYISQNQPQAERLASQVGQGVVQSGNQARSDLSNEGNTFNTAVTAGTVPFNQSVIDQVAHNPTGLFTYPSITSTPPVQPPEQHHYGHGGQNPPKVRPPKNNARPPALPPPFVPPAGNATVSNPSLFNQFEQQRNSQYTGPTDITQDQGYQTAQTDINAANQQGQNLQSDTGRIDALTSLYGNTYNNPGVQNFDNLLLQSAPSQNILNQSVAQNAELNPAIQNLTTQAGQNVQAGQTTAENTRNAVDSAFFGPQGTYPAFQQDLQNRLTQAQQTYKNPNLVPSQIATWQDYQKLQALNQLLGTNYSIG